MGAAVEELIKAPISPLISLPAKLIKAGRDFYLAGFPRGRFWTARNKIKLLQILD